MKTAVQATVSSTISLGVVAAALFVPAGTVRYWQGWTFLAIMVLCSLGFAAYLGVKNPDVLKRRLHAGPAAETRPAQKLASTGVIGSYLVAIIVSAFDHRFGWSHVPPWVQATGAVLSIIGLVTSMVTVVQNSYAAANITIESGQTVTTNGLYSVVRHPMYAGSLLMIVGMPLLLGSYWGLLAVIPEAMSLVARIIDEEKLLVHQLRGYPEYVHRVHARLIPLVW